MTARLVIAGPETGVGKTTVVAGIARALARRGRRVQVFKVGPDFIDPGYHTVATGRPARNLDPWLLGQQHLHELFIRAAAPADLVLIEGMMGLFDGRSGSDESGSTADVARRLAAPVVLVVDVWRAARSAAATVLGFRDFDPALPVAGVIINRAGSPTHAQWVAEAITTRTGLPCLGWLPARPDFAWPERHLGLVPTAERADLDQALDQLADLAAAQLKLDAIERLARAAPPLAAAAGVLFPPEPVAQRVAIAVAQDAAFSFYYQDNLDLLAAWGAEIVPFSPLRDERLPRGIGGIYLGGGFPEVYAAELAANEGLRRALRAASRHMVIYAECGGFMYLGRFLTDVEGRSWAMAGLLPCGTRMQSERPHLAYLTIRARRPTPVLPAGATVRAHEFHWSELVDNVPPRTAAYEILEHGGRLEGYARGRLLASYVHLHFGTDPAIAPRLVAWCARARREARPDGGRA